MNKRKIEVVQHALVLFQEKGIIQTSIQDIIERSSISKGTFYNYFKSKNECIYAAIEHVRYEASLIRSEIQLGKSSHDLDVLIEQIVKISTMNQLYGLPAIFEEMLVSLDKELKEYVKLYRVHEVVWFSNRIVDIYGEEVRAHSFEIAVLFYGMVNHVRFIQRLIEPTFIEDDFRRLITSMVTYLQPIIDNLQQKQIAIFNQQHVAQMLAPLKKTKLQLSDLLAIIESFKEKGRLTKYQLELIEAIAEEMQRENLRLAVLSAILPPFLNAFKNSDLFEEARQIHTQIWLYINQKKSEAHPS